MLKKWYLLFIVLLTFIYSGVCLGVFVSKSFADETSYLDLSQGTLTGSVTYANGTVTCPSVSGQADKMNIKCGYHSGSWCIILKPDNTAWATGYASDGVSCQNTSTVFTTPVQIQNSTISNNVKNIEANYVGNYSVYLLTNGDIYTCGYTYNSVYTPVKSDITNAEKIMVAGNLTFALRSDGTLWRLGKPNSSQVENLTNVVDFAVHMSRGIAVKSDGTVWVFNTGYGSTSNHIPSSWCPSDYDKMLKGCQVPGISGAVKVATTGNSDAVLLSDSTVSTWGYIPELGRVPYDTTYLNTPGLVKVNANTYLTNVVSIIGVIQGYYSALLQDGTVYNWGSTWDGWRQYATYQHSDKVFNIIKVINASQDSDITIYDNGSSYTRRNHFNLKSDGYLRDYFGNAFTDIFIVEKNGAYVGSADILPGYSVKNINVTQTGDVRFLVKDESNGSWKRWNSTQSFWQNATNFDYASAMTETELEAIPENAWKNLTAGKEKIWIGALFKSAHSDSILSSIEITQAEVIKITNISCPSTLRMGEGGSCSVVADSSGMPLTYAWANATGSTGGVFNPSNTAETTVYFTSAGTKVVEVSVSLQNNPSFTSKAYVVINVTPITMTLDGSCPSSTNKFTLVPCTANATTDWGTINYQWTVGSGGIISSSNGGSAEVLFMELGQKTVTVKAYLTERTDIYLTKTMQISVNPEAPVINSAGCSGNVALGQGVSCNINAVATDGTLRILWSTTEQNATISGSSTDNATVTFKTPGEKTIKVRAYLQENPDVATERTIPVTVQENPITAELTCPEGAITNEPFTCTFTASIASGSISTEIYADRAKIVREGNTALITPTRDGSLSVKLTVSLNGVSWLKKEVVKTVAVANSSYFTPVIKGAKAPYVGTANTYSAEAPCITQEVCTIKWSAAGSEHTGNQFTVTFPTPEKYTITAEVIAGSETIKTVEYPVYVAKLPKPILTIKGPSALFVGNPRTYTIEVPEKYNTLALAGEWILPDGSRVTGTEVTINPSSEGYFNLQYEAWVDGYKATTLNLMKKKIYAAQYVFPAPKINVRSSEALAPYNITFMTKDTYKRILGAEYNITYTWNFGDGEQLVTDNTIIHHTYQRAGSYNVTMTATDQYNNTSTDTLTITTGIPPVEVGFKISSSNKFMRVPVEVYVRSVIKKGNTLDRLENYEWKVNDQIVTENTRAEYARLTFNQAGSYVVTYKAIMASGAIGIGTTTIEIQPNQLPTCSIEYTDNPTSRYVYLKAVCSDPDGRMSGYKWDLDDGRGVRNGSTTISFLAKESRTYNITLIAADDTGDTVTVNRTIDIVR